MTNKRIAVGMLAGLVLLGGVAWAGKPGGGGGGGPVDAGTIYFTAWNGSAHQLHSMNPDGSGKTALPVVNTRPGGVDDWQVNSRVDVSHALHNGHRWFLQLLQVPGEPKINGSVSWEIAAFSDNGTVVRLTTCPPDFQGGYARWSPDDGRIAFLGAHWDPARGTAGLFWNDGFYVADMAYDPSGNPVGLVSTPTVPTIAYTFFGTSPSECDWSPDGTRIVFPQPGAVSPEPLVIANVSTGSTSVLNGTASQPRNPQWSPDGAWISYFVNDSAVRRIRPDGTGDTLLFQNTYANKNSFTRYGPAIWSPNSVNLLLEVWTPGRIADIGRSATTGGTVTKLTSDLNARVIPLKWR
jgi:hypothetical protein